MGPRFLEVSLPGQRVGRLEMKRSGLVTGKVERFALLDAEALQRHAANSGFSWAVAETLQGIERARNAWSMAESGMPQMMREAVIEHWNEVPLLRTYTSRALRARQS